jgi:hypothetical protein
MAKTKRKWIVLDYTDPDALRAEDIPFNSTTSIKEAIDLGFGKGQTGIQGVTGAQGNPGTTGIGATGATGIQGVTGITGSSYGSDLPMLHPDQTHSPTGPLDWDSSTPVTTGLDQLNNLLGLVLPATPGDLTGSLTLSATTTYSAILPTGLSSTWYQGGYIAGNTITGYLTDSTYVLTSPSTSTAFKCGSTFAGDVGTVSNLIDGTSDSSRNIIDGAGTSGNLTIDSVSTYNTIWRRANAHINYTQSSEGYRSHQMRYQATAIDQTTSRTELWYDNINETPAFPSGISVTQHTLSSSRYLSGIQYYYIGDSFDATSSVTGIADKCIRPTNPISYVMSGISTQNVAINGASFAYNQQYDFTATNALTSSNVYSINARMIITATKPSGTTASSTSASENRLINTYSTSYSTNCNIAMIDERYRWQLTTNFNLIPTNYSNPTGDWTSSNALLNGNGQLYNNTWWYPNINYTSGYLPAQTANYSAFSGDQTIVWACNIGTHSSMNIIFTGINYTDISPVGSGSLNMEIILPTGTGWLDCGKSFGDGSGCRNDGGSSGTTLALTFGTHSSSESSGVVFIRATLKDSSCAKASLMTISGT